MLIFLQDQTRYWVHFGAVLTFQQPPPGLFSERSSPVGNVWAYLRANKLAITVFNTYEEIVDACCKAWNFFANDPAAVTSITSRQWAAVS